MDDYEMQLFGWLAVLTAIGAGMLAGGGIARLLELRKQHKRAAWLRAVGFRSGFLRRRP